MFLTAKDEKEDLRSGMNLGADDYLTKPVGKSDLLKAIEARLQRSEQQARRDFKPDFSSAQPLLRLGLTPRAAEALLWVAQGKTNSDIATILGISESTVKSTSSRSSKNLELKPAAPPPSAPSRYSVPPREL